MKDDRTAEERAGLARELRAARRVCRVWARRIQIAVRTCDDNGLPESWFHLPRLYQRDDDKIVVGLIDDRSFKPRESGVA